MKLNTIKKNLAVNPLTLVLFILFFVARSSKNEGNKEQNLAYA